MVGDSCRVQQHVPQPRKQKCEEEQKSELLICQVFSKSRGVGGGRMSFLCILVVFEICLEKCRGS